MVVLVTHTFLTLVMAGGLLVASLPDDPMRVGLVEPIWWWFPLAVVAGFRLELVVSIGVFLAFQWLIRRRTSAAALAIAAIFLVAADVRASIQEGMQRPEVDDDIFVFE
jgi:hypothetical protein